MDEISVGEIYEVDEPAAHHYTTYGRALPDDMRLFELIREDWHTHCRAWVSPGFRAIAVHRFGVWRMGIRFRIFRAPFSVLYRALFRYIRKHYRIDLPYSAWVGRRVKFDAALNVNIHGNAVIGDDCVIASNVTLGIRSIERVQDAPVLGDRVSVGDGASVLGNVHVGDDARIFPGAVVLDDVPPGMIADGNPAKVVHP